MHYIVLLLALLFAAPSIAGDPRTGLVGISMENVEEGLGYDAVVNISAAANPCLAIQAALNPWLASDFTGPWTVAINGNATIDNGDLWDQGGTREYGLCFGLIPAGPSTDATAWLGTYPNTWPNPKYDANGAGAGTAPPNKYFAPSSGADRRLTIIWNASITYSETVGQHGGGAADRPTVIYQKGNAFLGGHNQGYIAGGVNEQGQLHIVMAGDDDGGLAMGTSLTMCPGLVCAGAGTVTQVTASVAIMELEYTRNVSSVNLNLTGTLNPVQDTDGADNTANTADDFSISDGGVSDNDNIGYIRANTWDSGVLGGGYIQGFGVGILFYEQNASPMEAFNVEYNNYGVLFGSYPIGADYAVSATCAVGTCTQTTNVSASGNRISNWIIEGNWYGEVVGFDTRDMLFIDTHIESAIASEGDRVLDRAGVCVEATLKRVCSADIHCDTGQCDFPPTTGGAELSTGGFHFKGGSLPSDIKRGTYPDGISTYNTRAALYAGFKLGPSTGLDAICVANDDPIPCCSGAGVGNCDIGSSYMYPNVFEGVALGSSVPTGSSWANGPLSWIFEFAGKLGYGASATPMWFNGFIFNPLGARFPMAAYEYTNSLSYGYPHIRSDRERAVLFQVDEEDDAAARRDVAAADCLMLPNSDPCIEDDANADGDCWDAGENSTLRPPAWNTALANQFCAIPPSYYSNRIITGLSCTSGDRTNWATATGSDTFRVVHSCLDANADGDCTDQDIQGNTSWDEYGATQYSGQALSFGTSHTTSGVVIKGVSGAQIATMPGSNSQGLTPVNRGWGLAFSAVATHATLMLPHKYTCEVSYFDTTIGIQ